MSRGGNAVNRNMETEVLRRSQSAPLSSRRQTLECSSRSLRNMAIQEEKVKLALKQPNIERRPRSWHQGQVCGTPISAHPKFLREPAERADFAGQSPFAMRNNSDEKYRMSGYKGYVPGYRFLVGAGYPILTHDAMNEFTDRLKTRQLRLTTQVPLTTNQDPCVNLPLLKTVSRPIYPVNEGLIPNYMGHIPGHKFRFGQTFGHVTRNARQLPMTAR